MKIINKPWGRELIFAQNKKYVGKLIYINGNEKLSKQYHRIKHETLYLLDGIAFIEIGTLRKTTKYKKLDSRYSKEEEKILEVPPNTVHRIEAITNCIFLEVSTPQLKDIIRLEDSYGRVKKDEFL